MFQEYLSVYNKIILSSELSNIEKLFIKLKSIKKNSSNVLWIFGNGGSQAISSHISTDISKNTNIKSMTVSDADLITCFSNDYGYENYLYLCTFSGFDKKNPLRNFGNLNIWVNSKKYNFVEVCHLQLLTYLTDRLSKKI
jgi:D-sedoheptulose 7-phosphate isomerase